MAISLSFKKEVVTLRYDGFESLRVEVENTIDPLEKS